jgi:hypothetical protein
MLEEERIQQVEDEGDRRNKYQSSFLIINYEVNVAYPECA